MYLVQLSPKASWDGSARRDPPSPRRGRGPIGCATTITNSGRHMNETQDTTPPPGRQWAARAIRIAVLVVVGGFSCWLVFQVERRLGEPISTPAERDVTLDVIVSDSDTSVAISGAEVGIDMQTERIDPPGPAWKGSTDATGRFRLVDFFPANTVRGADGKVRGRVVFTLGEPMMSFSYLLAIKAPGYREKTIDLDAQFSGGIDYEDPSPRTVPVHLSPSPPQ